MDKRMSEFEFNYLFAKYKNSSLNSEMLRNEIYKQDGKYEFKDLCELVRIIKNYQIKEYGSILDNYDPIHSCDEVMIMREKSRRYRRK